MSFKVICIITHLYPVDENDYKGGFVRDLAVSLCHKGYDVHVVTPMRLDALPEENSQGVKIHRFFYRGAREGIQLGQLKGTPFLLLGTLVLSGIIKCVKIVIQSRADLIHSYWVVPGGLIAMFAGLLTGRPVVATAAGSDLNIASKNKIYKILIRLTLKGVDKLIAVSDSMKQTALSMGLHENKAVVFPGPSGIDVDLYTCPGAGFTEMRGRGRKILYAGNLAHPKRVDTILKAVKIVADTVADVSLTIIGDGDQRVKLETLAENLGIKDKVFFKGAVPHREVPMYMHNADIFVHCSENEGLPVAIMEAMTSGLPVIGSPVGGIPELISDNTTGYLVPYNDHKRYADKIISLLRDGGLRKQMGGRGLEIALARFSKKNILTKNIEVYETMINE